MTPNNIKTLLLSIYKKEFNINNYVSIYDTESEPFIYDAYFEYKTNKWHDAQLTIEGTIIKDSEPDYSYNPLNDGRCGESQGNGVFISSWSIDKISVELDGKEIDLISKEDLETEKALESC